MCLWWDDQSGLISLSLRDMYAVTDAMFSAASCTLAVASTIPFVRRSNEMRCIVDSHLLSNSDLFRQRNIAHMDRLWR